MPALWPMVIIPVPAPTTPSVAGPSTAPSMAARASATVTWRRRASSSHESSHSPTIGTGITSSSTSGGTASKTASTTASATLPIAVVPVKRIGASSVPHSAMEIAPVSSPHPLSTAGPAAIGRS